MIRFLPAIVEVALLVFCVIDILQTPEHATRNLSKGWWLVLVIIVPLIGGIGWLVAGRAQRDRSRTNWGPGAGFPEYQRPAIDTTGIDRRLQADLERLDREEADARRAQEARLRTKQAELSAREAELERRERDQRSGEASI
ncbi:MAG: PLD nuclease N-terminal domain-containing protein [Candidatus Nanopelagicales bacterium]